MWVLDYLDEIDSDMSVFHRVDDARTTMPPALYFGRAEMLPAYPGIMRVRAQQVNERGGAPASASAPIVSDDWIEHDTGGTA